MDHLLPISNARGGGVEGFLGMSTDLKEMLQKDYERIKKAKKMNENKRQHIQIEIALNYKPFSLFSSSMDEIGSSSQVMSIKSRETTLNSLWKPVQKQEVDDVEADMFFESAIPLILCKFPNFMLQNVLYLLES